MALGATMLMNVILTRPINQPMVKNDLPWRSFYIKCEHDGTQGVGLDFPYNNRNLMSTLAMTFGLWLPGNKLVCSVYDGL